MKLLQHIAMCHAIYDIGCNLASRPRSSQNCPSQTGNEGTFINFITYLQRSFKQHTSFHLIYVRDLINIHHSVYGWVLLTHWGRVTHICVNKLTVIGSDNGLSPGQRQPIIWPNAGILLIGTMGRNFSEILIQIRSFSFKKMHLKMSSGKWQPFGFGLNVLTQWGLVML